jgi:hypothetical protein
MPKSSPVSAGDDLIVAHNQYQLKGIQIMFKFRNRRKVRPVTVPVTNFAPYFDRPVFQSIDANDIRIAYREDSCK